MATSAVSNLPEHVQCGSYTQNPWYLVKSKPTQEEVAKSFLNEIGVDVLLPQYVSDKSSKRKPFFPGYLFASFPQDLYWSANKAIGVHRIVHFGMNPAIVPFEVIAQLNARMLKNGLIDLPMAAETRFHAGDTVQVVDGPFRGFHAVFDCSLSAGDRVRVLLDTVSRMPVEVGRHDVMLI